MSGTLFSFIIIYEAERLYKSEFTKKKKKKNAVSVTEVFFLAWCTDFRLESYNNLNTSIIYLFWQLLTITLLV